MLKCTVSKDEVSSRVSYLRGQPAVVEYKENSIIEIMHDLDSSPSTALTSRLHRLFDEYARTGVLQQLGFLIHLPRHSSHQRHLQHEI